MIKARIIPHFKPLDLQLLEVTPQHIEDFYQTILDDDCTTNTVIHYHAILRKAMQVAVKKDIIKKNPVDKVQRPKKNTFHGNFYNENEMMVLFDAISGDPLELLSLIHILSQVCWFVYRDTPNKRIVSHSPAKRCIVEYL